jgi:hypothetical protein
MQSRKFCVNIRQEKGPHFHFGDAALLQFLVNYLDATVLAAVIFGGALSVSDAT